MSVGIRLDAPPDGGYRIRLVAPWTGWWLEAYDPDAREGLGQATFVEDSAFALRFESFDDAKAYWFRQSELMPTVAGPKGDPIDNRPLACCSIMIEDLAAVEV